MDAGVAPDPRIGNPVLNARIEFLKSQGLPVSSIPLCHEAVPTMCPCTGKPAASAGQQYIEARTNEKKQAAGMPCTTSLLEVEDAGTGRTKHQGKEEHESSFSGALMTSGSFTMMA